MKKTEPKSIAEIIREGIEQVGLSSTVAEQRACYVWPEIVGPGINRYTFKRYVDRGVLHVHITSAALKNELSFNRSSLVEQINRAVGSNAITSIVFH
ncbi:MAG: DUF721 domain-containing protein [Paramuribaculum sp.]|nr:DUF721 domain-containing protein [Paramuribaculum sp.]MDE6323189.1 DUF721 domain-containing protein [Paramuribaculum sp.]MDE6488769.1 DUF721 domain-containing protein [Paramuribaculum sp.]